MGRRVAITIKHKFLPSSSYLSHNDAELFDK